MSNNRLAKERDEARKLAEHWRDEAEMAADPMIRSLGIEFPAAFPWEKEE